MEFRLFVIDSSPAIHRLVEEAASTEGFEVTAFSDGPSCLDESSRTPPQMIIADFHLEGMTFTTFCDRLRDMNLIPSTLLLVLVNSSDRHDENGLRQRGVSAFIHKPVQIEQLRETIKELNESRMAAKDPKPARPRRSWPPESVTMGDDSPSVVEDAPAEESAPEPVAAKKEDPIEIRQPMARMSLPPAPAGTEDLPSAAAAAAAAARNIRLRSGEPPAPSAQTASNQPFKKDPSFSTAPAAPPPEPTTDQPTAAFAFAKPDTMPAGAPASPGTPPSRPEPRESSKDDAPAFAAAQSADAPSDLAGPGPSPTPPREPRQPSKDYAATVAAIQAAASPPEPPAEPKAPFADLPPAFAAPKAPEPPRKVPSPNPSLAPVPHREPRQPSKDYAATVAAIQAAASPPEDLNTPDTTDEAAAPTWPAAAPPSSPAPAPEAPAASVPPPPPLPAATPPEPAAAPAKGNGERSGNGGQSLPTMLEESMRGFLNHLLESLSQGSQAQMAQVVSNLVAEQVNAELTRKIQSEVAAQVAAALSREQIAKLAQQAAQEQLPGLVTQHLDAMERSVKQELTERTGEMVKDVTRKLLPEVTEPVIQRQLPDMVQQHMGLVDGLVKEAAQQAASGYTAEVAEKVVRQVATEQVAQLVTNAVADIAEAQVKRELERLTASE